ncbi:outer membrane lipoprotein-sorting protein [Fibrivirga algicola]|uniref:Outer membrane lipoprotein-sorting protein n=1 Tax=Fibrivirga algicola TaxID=2950420 RepID=A0ABX0QQ84_9BACT|nr:outer membrane lipoprotein-sorting protein [Fibrivirga algicola]NID13117.1 outer membrane lipoprotein-sorting protein [Fibrivirga algicola]
MKKNLLILTSALLLSVASHAQTLDEVVSKHITAIGGRANLNAFKSAKYTQSTIAPGQTIDATATVIFDKAVRIDMSMGGTDIVVATKGDAGWAKQGNAQAKDVPADQLKAITESVTLPGLELANASMKGQKIDFKGKETIDGKAYYALTIPIQGGISTFYLDPATYLVALRKGSVQAMGQTLDTKLEYDEYKKAGSITLPYRVKTEAMGQSATVRLTAFEANPAIDEAIFTKPKQ